MSRPNSRSRLVTLPDAGDAMLVVGPEGGVAPEELEALVEAGGVAVRLSDGVLRTDRGRRGACPVAGDRAVDGSVSGAETSCDDPSGDADPASPDAGVHGSDRPSPCSRSASHLPDALGRTGVIRTPHGAIRTPAFVVVGTKATVKAVPPEAVAALGAQAVLANAYHLFLAARLRPRGRRRRARGVHELARADVHRLGGFQVMSQGVGLKKAR